MSTWERRERLGEFKEAKWGTVSNARCLNEGIDVPAVDLVAFMDPKRSRIDIVQAAGRAMRLSPETGKTCGYILLPVFLDMQSGESLDEALQRTGFDEVEKVLQALAESDSSLAETIRELREAIGRDGKTKETKGGDGNLRHLREKVKVLGPVGDLAWMREVIAVWTEARLIERLTSEWYEMYGRLRTYWEKHGDCNVPRGYPPDVPLSTWIVNQRFRKDRLSPEQIQKLDEIGFTWDPHDHRWLVMYSRLLAFWEKHEHCNVPGVYDVKLLNWIGVQRTNKDRLSPEQIRKLDEIGFVWDVFDARWEAMFQATVKFVNKFDHCIIPVSYCDGPLRVGRWANAQRNRYNNKKSFISPDQVRRLIEIGFEWDGRMLIWKMRLSELRQYYEQHGDCNVPKQYIHRSVPKGTKLGDWCSTQRQMRRKGTLTIEKIAAIDAIGDGCFKWSRRPPASKDPNICVHEHVGAYRRDSRGVKYCGECRRFRSREKTRMRVIPDYRPGSVLGSLHSGAKTHCKLGHPLDGVQKRGDGSQVRYCKVCKLEAGRKRWVRLHPGSIPGPRTHCKLGHPLDGVSKLRGLFRQRFCTTCKGETIRRYQARNKAALAARARRSRKTRKLKAGRKRKR